MLKKIGKACSLLKLGVVYSWEKYHFLIPPKELLRGIAKVKSNLCIINGYEKWIKENETEVEYEQFEYNPLISIVIPHYNTPVRYLRECLDSALYQSYKNFEICIADDCSTNEESVKLLKEYEEKYSQIKVVWRKENGNISAATNSAIDIAKGEFIAFMDSDDVLAKDALYFNVKVLNENKALDLIYSDEDKLDFEGNRVLPHFKPDFSPDLLLSLNYICHFVVARATLAKKLKCRSEFDGAQDYDFLLRLTEKTCNIYHIPKVLYHWRVLTGSTSLSENGKPYIIKAWENAILDTLRRRNLNGNLVPSEHKPYYIMYENNNEKVSILISFSSNKHLRNCIKSVYKQTTYKNFEIILVGDREKIKDTGNFKIAPNYSDAIDISTGQFIVLLSDKLKIITSNWIEYMLGYARQQRIGYVGANCINVNTPIPNIKENLYKNIELSDNAMVTEYRQFVTSNYNCVGADCVMVDKLKINRNNRNDLCHEMTKLEYNNVYLPMVRLK